MSRIARVNGRVTPVLTTATGLGGTTVPPFIADLQGVDVTGLADGFILIWDAGSNTWVVGPAPSPTATSMFVPVMVEDGATGLWYVTVTGDGDAVMTEVPL